MQSPYTVHLLTLTLTPTLTPWPRRQIVTNHLLHFLALDRSDPKKFQILQLIAALLGWTEEQREQAGLSRPGTTSGAPAPTSSFGSLRGLSGMGMGASPAVHRTPSTPALNHGEYFGGEGVMSPSGRETLAELWQNFLEQEAAAGGGAAGGGTSNNRSGVAKSSQGSTSTVGGVPPTPTSK
ncbi:hypothetical protein CLCR_09181 [Cladophialophora carrionii]|uniref:GRIP domain-containing protein n=1 Tax=Cladophialophora carrionii TaxID=86049 RepID=A0A1C1CS75_9EURO|nr:hypothetical protein CLCR_09181 [Cladophialophora carrionii]